MSDVEPTGDPPSAADHPELERPSGPPSWVTVARKDVAAGARSWQLYVLSGVFTAVLLLFSLDSALEGSPRGASPREISAQAGMAEMAGVVGGLFPLIVLTLVHMSIVGERRRGSLRVLLGLPVTRGEVFLGTLVGRSVIVGGTLLAALAANGLAMAVLYDTIDVVAYAGFALAVVAFCTVFVILGVGISAAVRTRGRAVGLAMGAFVLSSTWIVPIVEKVTGVTPTRNIVSQDIAPGWYVLLERLRPAYGWRLVVTDWIIPVLPEFGRREETYYAHFTTAGPEPFYLDSWFLALALAVLWGVVPLLLGYWQFRGADIG